MKTGFSPAVRAETVYKTLTYLILWLFLAGAESSFLPTLAVTPVPSLFLSATIAVAYYEDERWASVFGLIGGYLTEATGNIGLSLLPLLYLFFGCISATLFRKALQKHFGAFLLYTACAAVLRMLVSALYMLLTYGSFPLGTALIHTLLPEAGLTLAFSPLLFLLVCLCGLRTRRRREFPAVGK